jgi:hypothetical protein
VGPRHSSDIGGDAMEEFHGATIHGRGAVEVQVLKKRKCETKKNPDAPKRFMSAYILFCIDKRPDAVAVVQQQQQQQQKQHLEEVNQSEKDALSSHSQAEKEGEGDAVDGDGEAKSSSVACSSLLTSHTAMETGDRASVDPHADPLQTMETQRGTTKMQRSEKMKGVATRRTPHGSQEFNTAVVVALSDLWRGLSAEAKEVWSAREKADKARFEAEVSQFKGPLLVPKSLRAKKKKVAAVEGSVPPPKRNPSAFLLFARDQRHSVAQVRRTHLFIYLLFYFFYFFINHGCNRYSPGYSRSEQPRCHEDSWAAVALYG